MRYYSFIFIALFLPLLSSAEGVFERDLFLGMVNDPDVVRLQEFLRSEGYFTYPESTGNYLSVTSDAVREFQKDNKVEPVGGFFGRESRDKANRILAKEQSQQKKMPPLSPHEEGTKTFLRDLSFGIMNDPDVVRLQEFLRDQGYFIYPESTGKFFLATRNAVIEFQIAHSINPAAGYFGPNTRAKANEILAMSGQTPPSAPPSAEGVPEYKGKIILSSVRGKSVKPVDEIIIITNRTRDELIDITGWKIKNVQNHTFTIPRVYKLPGLEISYLQNLVLPPKGQVTISVGKQDRHIDFQENVCTGYFKETHIFKPDISSGCPRQDVSTLTQFDDLCIQRLRKIGACKAPSYKDLVGIPQACSEYMSENFNYAGCVKNNRADKNFYSNQWHIWMQNDSEFFRNTIDTATLLDQFGRVVDEESY